MKKVIVIPNHTKDFELKVTKNVVNKLFSLGIHVYMNRAWESFKIFGVELYDNTPKDAELIVVVGGDGSIIDASGVAISLNIPMLGINLGKVGYLSEVDPDSLEVLEKLVDDDYNIEERMLLSAEKHAESGSVIESERLAMNDVILSGGVNFGISELVVENGRGDFIKYRADGVIFSTPVGSTAYSLSAGGPIISHNLSAITVTPVSPHSLFNRSIVYDDNECLKISNVSDVPLNVRIDGRFFAPLEKGEFCKVKKSDKQLKMLTFTRNNMFTTLFKKIKVLEDDDKV